jgi:hypothetical protein
MEPGWILFVLAFPIWGQSEIDWDKQKAESLKHFRNLIQIDTRAGNKTVEYIRRVLEAEGIPVRDGTDTRSISGRFPMRTSRSATRKWGNHQ